MISTESVEIIGITETWVDTAGRDFEGEYRLPGYSLFHQDRAGRAGGGVMLYAKRHLNPVQIPIVTPYEIVGAEVRGSEPKVQVFVCYRPPKHPLDADLALYETLSALVWEKTSVLAGDFNCSGVDWETDLAVGEGLRLLDFKHDNFLSQKVREPTRGANVLDLIFCSEGDLVSNVVVGECLAGSDHHMVWCMVGSNAGPEVVRPRDRLNLRRADYDGFCRDLLELPRPIEGSAEDMWSNFRTQYLTIQQRRIPRKRVGGTERVQPSWFHGGIGREVRKRKRFYHAAKCNPTPENERRLVNQRRVVKKMVRQAKVAEEHRVALACHDNPKEFFGYVNKHKPRAPLGPVFSVDGHLLTNDGEMAREFNTYFSNVFTVEDIDNIPDPAIVHAGENNLTDIDCAEPEVEAKLKELKPDKAAGSDGFLPKVLKAVAGGVVPHLCQIFNRSLTTAEVPQDFRSADVCPIPKKGLLTDTGNYRPISLTSVPGKVLESIIKDRVVNFLETNNLINTSQHGFRQGRSCVTNLLDFYHYVFGECDRSRAVDVVFLDFRKAFDKVPHKRLMRKVRALGIQGNVAAWIENWLAGRRQRVIVNGVPSDWTTVTSGVPQGSVLGPLLFVIYINDLDLGLSSKVSKFADDTKLGINAANPESVRALQRDLAAIGEWSTVWQMPFNLDKCHVLHAGAANQEENYSLLGSAITSVDQETDLGVVITADLKSSAQCIAAEQKAQKILGYIKRVFRYRNKQTVLALYRALVRPLLEYGAQFWSPIRRVDVERLEKVQARATRLVPSIRHKGYQRRLADLGLFTLEQRRLRGLLIETFKILRGFSGLDPASVFELSVNRTRNHGYKVVPPRFNTVLYRDFPTVRVCNLWNSLPEAVVNAPSVDAFKGRLDRILPGLAF